VNKLGAFPARKRFEPLGMKIRQVGVSDLCKKTIIYVNESADLTVALRYGKLPCMRTKPRTLPGEVSLYPAAEEQAALAALRQITTHLFLVAIVFNEREYSLFTDRNMSRIDWPPSG
jgi:hypothetical protein